jgi:hypothetical protein
MVSEKLRIDRTTNLKLSLNEIERTLFLGSSLFFFQVSMVSHLGTTVVRASPQDAAGSVAFKMTGVIRLARMPTTSAIKTAVIHQLGS